MAARSIEAFAVEDGEIGLEVRLLAGAAPGSITIEVRDVGEAGKFLDLSPELSRQFRLAVDKLTRVAEPKTETAPEEPKADAPKSGAKK